MEGMNMGDKKNQRNGCNEYIDDSFKEFVHIFSCRPLMVVRCYKITRILSQVFSFEHLDAASYLLKHFFYLITNSF